jgi:hypothetical protein
MTSLSAGGERALQQYFAIAVDGVQRRRTAMEERVLQQSLGHRC